MAILISKQEKFIKDILLNAAKNKMNKLDVIGSVEITKLIIFNNNINKSIDTDLMLFVSNDKDVKQVFVESILMSLKKFKISDSDGLGILETLKFMLYNTELLK